MIEVLRSVVNTWECDQMGHLNVRHYLAHAHSGMALLALQCGLPPSLLRDRNARLRARDQHVRFHRELRPGTPFVVNAGVLNASAERLQIFEELRSVAGAERELATTIVSEFELTNATNADPLELSGTVLQRAQQLRVELPDYAAARGIARGPFRRPARREHMIERGMSGAFLGPVLREDCDEHGRMLESAFMARVSDGIGHFFRRLREGLRPAGIGGAALEYRYVFHERPQLGDVIEVRSGLKALGNKTLHVCHHIFDVDSGACVASSEAVAVSFDLTTRKAIEIDDATRAVMQSHVLADVGIEQLSHFTLVALYAAAET